MCKIIPLLALLVIFAVSAWKTGYFDTPPAPVTVASEVMDFRWQSLDGKDHALSQLAGRPVVIHFWASWCAPCRTEFPKLLQASARVKDGTVFLTISSDEDKAKAQQFIRKSLAVAKIKGSIPVYYAFDPKQTIAFDTFQTVQYPETVFLDSQHHLRHKIAGVVDWDSHAVRGYLTQSQPAVNNHH